MTIILAVLIPAAIIITAIILAAGTPDVDAMADPTPRLGEDEHRPPALARAQTAWFPERNGWDQQ